MAKEFSLYIKIQNLASDDVHKRKYRISEGRELYFGRSAEFANVVLLDEGVSRQHALVKVENGELVIEDLNSGNGTFVEGSKITSTSLQEKQMIVMGGFEILVTKISTGEVDDASIEYHEEEIKKMQKAGGGTPMQASSKQGRKDRVDDWENARSVKGFIDLVKSKLLQLKDEQLSFFDNQNYDGEVKNSLIVATIATMVPILVGVLLSESSALYVLATTIAAGFIQLLNLYIVAFVFDRMKKWVGMDGSLDVYLRFFALVYILTFPFNLLANVPFLQIAALLNLPIGILSIYKFYKIFKPVLIRFIVAIIVTGVLNGIGSAVIMTGVAIVAPAPVVKEDYNNVIEKMKNGQKKLLDQAMEEN